MRTLIPFWTAGNLQSDLWSEMDRVFDGLRTASPSVYDERDFAPATEISEAENYYLLSTDLPGLKKEDIKIELVENNLTISGERKREQKTDEKNFHRAERNYGSFKRSYTLPKSVNAEQIEARYEDGVLEVYLPKAAAVQPRKIEIQAAGKSHFFDQVLSTQKDENAPKTSLS